MNRRTRSSAWLLRASVAAAWATCAWAVQAQPATAPTPIETPADRLSLRQVFEAAWARQPEAVALQARRDSALAQQRASQAWSPDAAAVEISNKTDRLNRNLGVRELEIGVTVPLWLPGERRRSAALADAESVAIESRATAAQLRVAGAVREAWWQWQRARIEAAAARDQLDSTGRIAADVARRVKAGDLAPSDRHQADGAVASAQASLAQTEADFVAAQQQLRALSGAGVGASMGEAIEAVEAIQAAAEAEPDMTVHDAEAHAAVQELKHRAAVAERSAALIASQSRANPELLLATTRDRGGAGEPAQQTFTLGLRLPFGGGSRHDARSAMARAEATEVQAQLALERERLAAEGHAARGRVQSSRSQLAAAERRAQLARESRGFFDKSFRLGEADLPTRLRIEVEAADAERQVARTRIELAAAISAWHQALGLLPR